MGDKKETRIRQMSDKNELGHLLSGGKGTLTMFLNVSSLTGLRLSFSCYRPLILISAGAEAKNVGYISCQLLCFRERLEANVATPLLLLSHFSHCNALTCQPYICSLEGSSGFHNLKQFSFTQTFDGG